MKENRFLPKPATLGALLALTFPASSAGANRSENETGYGERLTDLEISPSPAPLRYEIKLPVAQGPTRKDGFLLTNGPGDIESGVGPEPLPKSLPETTQNQLGWKRIAGILSCLSPLPFAAIYIPQVIKGIANANRVSWGIWAVNDTLLLGTSVFTGDRNSWLLPAGFVVSTAACFLVSLRYGESRKLTTLDRSCIAISGIGIAGFVMSHTDVAASLASPTTINFLANLAACSVNLLAALPTIRDFLKRPAPQGGDLPILSRRQVWGQLTPWSLAVIGPALAFASVQSYSFTQAFQPLALLFTGACLFASALYAQRKGAGDLGLFTLLFSKQR